MGPTYADERRSHARTSYHQFRDGAIRVARDACPMLACLVIPVVIVLGVAVYAATSERLDGHVAPAASAQAPGPYDGFRFEYVGAGVRRLIDDGAGYRPGDYRFLRGEVTDTIAVEPDGSVLACCDRPGLLLRLGDGTTLHRLGQREPVVRWEDRNVGLSEAHDLAVATDGTVWLAGDRVAELADDAWRKVRPRAGGHLLAAGRDGAMWADMSTDVLRIVRYEKTRFRVFTAERGLPPAVRAWGDRVTGIATTTNGHTWIGVAGKDPQQPGGLLRYDGQRWRVVRPLGRGVDAHVEAVAVAPDGTLWVYLSRSRPTKGAPWQATMHLARRDATGWTTFGSADGVPQHHRAYRRSGGEMVPMRAGPDGTVWLTTYGASGCARLVSFAARRTSEYLPDGTCVHDVALDPDGRAWVSVFQFAWEDTQREGAELYLVDPVR